jgi:hypothetical protein
LQEAGQAPPGGRCSELLDGIEVISLFFLKTSLNLVGGSSDLDLLDMLCIGTTLNRNRRQSQKESNTQAEIAKIESLRSSPVGRSRALTQVRTWQILKDPNLLVD